MDEDVQSFEGDEGQELHHRANGVRRALTMRSTAARHVSVNFMPSRQMSYDTLRPGRTASGLLDDLMTCTPDQQADVIARQMAQHQPLMEDNPDAEDLRREALRYLPQGMTMKRSIRAKLSQSVTAARPKPVTFWKGLSYKISFVRRKAKDNKRNLLYSIKLWHEHIRVIEGNLGSAVGSYFHFLRWLVSLDLALLTLVVAFVVIPGVLQTGRDDVVTEQGRNVALDFFNGQGIFERSVLFYGHYRPTAAPGYDMTHAYFFTMCCVYLLAFVVMCFRTAYSYRHNFIETGGGVRNAFANKVFCGWDFGIATAPAAALTSRSVYNELKELLAEKNRKAETLTACRRLCHFLWNGIVSAAALGLIAAVFAGLWVLLSAERTPWLSQLIVSVTITVVVGTSPVVFNFLAELEYYSPRTKVYVTLARTGLLDFGALFVLLYFWFNSNTDCWETSMGQETHRLLLLDALFSLVVLPVFEFSRYLAFKLNPKSAPPEFAIAYNSLTLIYNQALLWFGLAFSPLLVVGVTAKFLLLFYVKKEVALRTCYPARKVWRAAQTQTVMYMLCTLSLFITLFGLGHFFVRSASHACGPFVHLARVYHTLTEGALRLSRRRALAALLAFATRPGFIAFVLLFLCVAVYIMRARSRAHRSMVDILRQMLLVEAKDKDFLLDAIAKVANGEWLYSPRPEQGPAENSHTWKYLHDERTRKPSNADYAFDGSRVNHSLLDASRPRSHLPKDIRPNSYVNKNENREDGDTDSSFSWQGSGTRLNDPRGQVDARDWL